MKNTALYFVTLLTLPSLLYADICKPEASIVIPSRSVEVDEALSSAITYSLEASAQGDIYQLDHVHWCWGDDSKEIGHVDHDLTGYIAVDDLTLSREVDSSITYVRAWVYNSNGNFDCLEWERDSRDTNPQASNITPSQFEMTITEGSTVNFQYDVYDPDGDIWWECWWRNNQRVVDNTYTGLLYNLATSYEYTFNSTGDYTIVGNIRDATGNDQVPQTLWTVHVVESADPIISHISPFEQSFTATQNETVNFSVSATDDNADLDHFSFWYNHPDDYLGSSSCSGGYATKSWNHTFTELGSQAFSAIIYDEDLNWDMYTWNVEVEEPSYNPELTPVNPLSLTGNVITVGDQIDFEVTASDANGNLMQFWWYYDGDLQGVTFPTNGYNSSADWQHTFNEVGSHEMKIIVYDDLNNDDTLIWEIDVEEEPSDPPVLEPITPTQMAFPVTIGESVNFGVDATDINSDLSHFRWVYDTDTLATSSASGNHDTDYWDIDFNELGVHAVKAFIFDDDYNVDHVTWNINVVSVPVPPEIVHEDPDAAITIEIMENSSVDFTVLAEDDNGDLASFKWYVDDVRITTHGASGGTDIDNWSHNFNDPGSHVVTLRVFDSLNNQDNISWNLDVEESLPPVVIPVNPSSQTQTININQSIDFQITATDANGDLKECRWFINSNPIVTHEVSGGSCSDNLPLTFYEDGTSSIMVVVYDEEGGNTSYTWTINVIYPPTAPNISRISPSSSSVAVLEGNTASFSVRGTDVNANLDEFKWYVNGSLVATHPGSGSNDTDSWSQNFGSHGTYIIKARVEDTDNLFDELTWTLHVCRAPSISRNSPSSSITIAEGESVTFSAHATDPDGDLDEFKWYLNGAYQTTHNASGSSDDDTWSYTFNSIGSYTIRSRIYDYRGFNDYVNWSVTVIKPPTPPMLSRVNPTQENVSVMQWEAIDFEANVSDVNGDLSRFEWYLNDSLVQNTSASGSSGNDSWFIDFTEQDIFDIDVIAFDNGGHQDSLSWQITVDEATGTELITVEAPESGDSWLHYQNNTSVTWSFPAVASYDSVKVDVYKAGNLVGMYTDWIGNDGEFTLADIVHPAWGTGSDFRLKVYDQSGNYGWSGYFTIGNVEISDVSLPNSGTVWTHFSTDNSIHWDSGSMLGGTVAIQLYQGSTTVGTLAGTVDNDGVWVLEDMIPMSWSPGTDYRVKVIDIYGDWGWSDEFEVELSTGDELFQFIQPLGTTTWEHYQTETSLVWEHPALLYYDSVKVDIYIDGVFLDIFADWTDNDGQYTRTTGIYPSWGSGSGYHLRIFDGSGNYGWSEKFTIQPAEVIDISQPSSSTSWVHLSSNHAINWDDLTLDGSTVRISLYKGTVLVEDLASSTGNDGEWILEELVPRDWSPDSDYRIKIVDNYGDWGWSGYFSVDPSTGSEVITVTNPNSSTTWYQYGSNYPINWTYPALLSGTTVDISIYLDGILVETLVAGTSNDDSWIYQDLVPMGWTADSTYQIYIQDDLGNFGWGEEFKIEPASGVEVITVTSPTSSTSWAHGQTGTATTWIYPLVLSGENVRIDIYKDAVLLDSYVGWVTNDGQYTRSQSIPSSWGTGSNYQLKIYDENDNYGWSASFSITGSEIIDVTEPVSSDIWMHFSSGHSVSWNDDVLGSSTVSIALYKGTTLIETFVSSTSNDGEWILEDMVPESWTPDSDYRIKIIDDFGDWGWSDYFSVEQSSNSEIISVIEPGTSTTWTHFTTDLPVNWEYPSVLDDPLSGDYVSILLYNGESFVDTLVCSTTNDSSWLFTDPVPMSWTPDSTYRIFIEDDLGNYGLGEYFAIAPAIGSEVITVTAPTSSTSWIHGQTGTEATWAYPAILSGNSITIDIYSAGILLDSYAVSTANDGQYTRSEAIPSTWGSGYDYQLKVYDDLGNYGWSDAFSITGIEIIDVTEPVSSSTWMHFSSGHSVSWDDDALGSSTVDIALYRGATLIEVFVSSTSNDGEWTFEDMVPESWTPDSDYRVRIIDDFGDWGWSDYFSIDQSSNAEIISVIEPGASTTWTHFTADLPVIWEYPAVLGLDDPLSGDNVSILLYNGASFIDTLVSSTANDNSWLFTDLVPMSWTADSTYRIYIEDDLGNYGWGEYFTIAPTTGSEVIAVNAPTSSTSWIHGQTGTEATWTYPALLSGSSIIIDIYSAGILLDSYAASTANDGQYTRSEPIPSWWDVGDDYQLKIYDDLGNYGWSESFSITGGDLFEITDPVSSTVWTHFASDYPISWLNPGLMGLDEPLVGDTVSLTLFRDSIFVETLASSISNEGSWIYTDPVPMSWSPGSNYMIYIQDNLGDYGWSDAFSIAPVTGSDIITVLSPNASTTWAHYEFGTEALWEYPAILSGDSVQIDIYKSGTYLGAYSEVIPNDGQYLHPGVISALWGSGDDYQLKIYDDQGNFGWSEEFSIEIAEVIDVSTPSSNTVWMHFSSDNSINWDSEALQSTTLSISLYKDTSLVETLTGLTINDGEWIYEDVIPVTLEPGTDYRILIEDNLNDWGWSEYFSVEPSTGAEVVSVTDPNGSSVWYHFESNYQVSWHYPGLLGLDSGDNVSILLYQGAEFADTLVSSTVNDESWLFTDLVPMSWTPDNNYSVYIEDDLGNYGWSAEFTIESVIGEVITVTNPVSDTAWSHYQSGNEVTWQYPALLYCDSVRIDIYKGGNLLAEFSDWTDNDGQYISTDTIPANWGSGDDYQLKIYDDIGNYGWSEEFSITGAEVVELSSPSASTIWEHYNTDYPVNWNSEILQSTNVSISLYKDTNLVETLTALTLNDGEWILDSAVSHNWGYGSDYRIHIVDNYGDWGMSEFFTLQPTIASPIITITDPDGSSVWKHFTSNLPINWQYPALLGLDDPLASDSVFIVLYHEAEFVDTLASSTGNDGSWVYTDLVPMSWTPDNNYRVYIEDVLGNFGWSDQFAVEPETGAEVITVTAPNSSTEWLHSQTDTEVDWSYPAILSGDSVQIDIYKGGTLLDSYSELISNDGHYIRTEAIPSWWGIGDDYQLRIYDEYANYGWTEEFTISGIEAITVTEPISSTVWTHFESNYPISWGDRGLTGLDDPLTADSVSITLCDGEDVVVEVLTSSTVNDGSWILTDPVPMRWTPYLDYRIYIQNIHGDYGWSYSFTVEPVTGSEVITINNPYSSTSWLHYQSDTEVDWSYPAVLSGDSVQIDIYKDDILLDSFSESTANDGQFIRTDIIPPEWGTGDDYQIYIHDNLDNYGWSEEFSITLSSGADIITVTEPTASTAWIHFASGHPVIWEYPSLLGLDGPLSGDSVSITLCKDSVFVDSLVTSTLNDGEWQTTDPVSMSWGTGNNYRLYIEDNLGNFGCSELFSIDPVSGSGIITVSDPVSSTVWKHFEIDLPISWQYPAQLALDGPLSGDSVSITLYKDSVFVDSLASSTPNTGEWQTTDPVSMSWIPAGDYQISIEDNLGNYGWSELFTIEPSTGAEVITILEPDASTQWTNPAADRPVVWEYPAMRGVLGPLSGDSVSITLYKESVFVDSLIMSTPNTGTWVFADSLPVGWESGSDYLIIIEDNFGNFGWSDYFEIETSLGVEEEEDIEAFKIFPIVPNPSSNGFTVNFAVPETSNVAINVFDLAGRHVLCFSNTEYLKGVYSVNINSLPPGIYFCTMRAREYEGTERVVVIR